MSGLFCIPEEVISSVSVLILNDSRGEDVLLGTTYYYSVHNCI